MSYIVYLKDSKPYILEAVNEDVSILIPLKFEILSTTSPDAHLTLGRMPLSIWRTVMSFFRRAYLEDKSEAQVRLFYNKDTRQWKAWAFPQEKDCGMTTKELPEHPGFQEQMNAMTAAGFHQNGTIHSHCMMGAFASSVDTHDEERAPGIHITMGKIMDDKIDLHARFTVLIAGTQVIDFSATGAEAPPIVPARVMHQKVDLTEFLGLPPEYVSESAPEEIKRFAVNHLLTLYSEELVDADMVELWNKNRIEKPPLVRYSGRQQGYAGTQNGVTGTWMGGQFYPDRGAALPGRVWPDNTDMPGAKKNKKRESRRSSRHASSGNSAEIALDLVLPAVDALCGRYYLTRYRFEEIISMDESKMTAFEKRVYDDIDSNILLTYRLTVPRLLGILDRAELAQEVATMANEGGGPPPLTQAEIDSRNAHFDEQNRLIDEARAAGEEYASSLSHNFI